MPKFKNPPTGGRPYLVDDNGERLVSVVQVAETEEITENPPAATEPQPAPEPDPEVSEPSEEATE